jgi:hypothetical protein
VAVHAREALADVMGRRALALLRAE